MSDWRERIVEIKRMRVGDILPNDHNARVHPPTQDAAVTQSLESVGKADVLRAYYSERNGGKLTLWDGHARQNLDPDQVWNVAITDLTDGEADQMLLTFDPLAGMAEWDKELTDQLLRLNDDLGGELAKLAADVADLAGLDFEPTAAEDGYEIPEEISTDIVLGDLFEIGEHRLLCGDSTDAGQVARLMNGEKADMVFTDPPYGIDYSGGRSRVVTRKTFEGIIGDDLKGKDLANLISCVFSFNKKDADIYICVSPVMQKPFLDFVDASDREIESVIVWDKKQMGPGYVQYRRQCEFILFVKGKDFCKGDNSDSDLWSIHRDNGSDYKHPNQKPVLVSSRAIGNSSKIYDLILDLFLGSGSTMVAAHQLKRKCYGMELDPVYCQVIIDRMKKLDPTLVVKKNGVALL